MSTTHYQIYKEKTFKLAKTLVVKLEVVSETINSELALSGYPLIDPEMLAQFPYTRQDMFHKYYQNMAGVYHISDQIKLQEQYGHPFMQISLATNVGMVKFDFTRELLERDPAVANEYQHGSYYYNQLVEVYPEHETLLLGILHPIELDISVQAEEGEILFCGGFVKGHLPDDQGTAYIKSPTGLVEQLIESQEVNFILDLQTWINKYLFRWTNNAYALTDDLYVAASLGIMYLKLPLAIMNIRLDRCHTSMAHTFHVREYLDSHGRLGHVIDYLPIESVMWLYRNTRYYECNQGKELTLKAIVDNVFTPSGVPLAGYDTSHNTAHMIDEVTRQMKELLPRPELVRETLNFENIGVTNAVKTVRDILEEVKYKARMNERDIIHAEERIESDIKWCGDDTLSTKLIESEMIPLSNDYPFTLTHVLMNMWAYCTEQSDEVNKSFTGSVFATNPVTGSRMVITPRNAYMLAMYCLNKGFYNIEMQYPLTGKNLEVRNIPRSDKYTPTPQHTLKPDPLNLWQHTAHSPASAVMEMYGDDFQPDLHFKSTEDFNVGATSVYLEMIRQYLVYTHSECIFARAELELVMNRMYWGNVPCTFNVDTTYLDWMDQIGIDISGLNEVNLINLGLELVSNCTGLELSLTKKNAETQKAAIDVLQHFASYTILVTDKVSGDVSVTTDTKMLRLANIKTKLNNSTSAKIPVTLDADLPTKEYSSSVYETFGEEIGFMTFEKEVDHYQIDTNHVGIMGSTFQLRDRIDIGVIGVMNASIDIPDYYDSTVPPPPEKQASDMVYYKSKPYASDED